MDKKHIDISVLNEISQAISHLTPDAALRFLSEKVLKVTRAACTLFLTQHEKSNQMAPFVTTYADSEHESFEQSEVFLKECFKYYIKYHETSSSITNSCVEPAISNFNYRFYAWPVILAGKPIAMLVVASFPDSEEISSETKSFIETISPFMGSLFDNQRLENEMIHKNSRLSALYEISQQTESAIDFRNVYSALSKVARSFIIFDAYQLYFLSHDGTLLEAKSNEPGSESLPKTIKIGEGPIGLAAKKCEPQLAYMGEFNSVLILPIEVSGKLIGVFAIASHKAYAYRNEDVIGLQIIASHIASIDMMFKDLLSLKGFTERILDSMHSGVLIFDKEGRVSYANPEIKLMMRMNFPDSPDGWSPITSEEKLPGELNDLMVYALKNNLTIENRKLRIKLPGATFRDLEVNAFPFRSDETGAMLGTACFIKDITQLSAMEEQLRRADKLSAIGMLAAGIAHEIRNPLTGMKMITQLLESEYDEDDLDKREPLGIIQKEINRLEGIVGNLLDFAKPGKFKIVEICLKKVLDDCHALIKNQLRKQNIAYSLECASDQARIKGDPDQIKQVFINIMTNAIQAQSNGGKLAVKIYKREDLLITEFRDSGLGIAQDKMRNIFNPFMTTKEDGTGLGLSMAQRIVEEHGGRIEVQSEVGEGSTFSVCLPLKSDFYTALSNQSDTQGK